MVRRPIDTFLAAIAAIVLRAFFRKVEVRNRRRMPHRRPVLVVANHFNGFVDPVMLVYVLRRLPRFMAKGTLWNVWPARPLLWLAGLIPVYRPEDRQGEDNTSTFAACHEYLSKRGMVALFPEGTTHDDPHLAKVRTGAARIALGAKAQGVDDIVILPIGLAFEDKLAMRSRVVAFVGDPIDLDADLDDFVRGGEAASEQNRDAVRRLTDEIDRRLRKVSPDFSDRHERGTLELAAEISLREQPRKPPAEVSFGDRLALAQRLAEAPAGMRRDIDQAVAEYNLDLTLSKLRDDQIAPHFSVWRLAVRFMLTALVVLILLPFMIIGTIVNILPYLIVLYVGSLPEAPVSKGTLRFLVGIVAFAGAWAGFAAWWSDGTLDGFALVLLFAVSGALTVFGFEMLVRLRRAFRGWRNQKNRRFFLEALERHRAEVVTAVTSAADAA